MASFAVLLWAVSLGALPLGRAYVEPSACSRDGTSCGSPPLSDSPPEDDDDEDGQALIQTRFLQGSFPSSSLQARTPMLLQMGSVKNTSKARGSYTHLPHAEAKANDVSVAEVGVPPLGEIAATANATAPVAVAQATHGHDVAKDVVHDVPSLSIPAHHHLFEPITHSSPVAVFSAGVPFEPRVHWVGFLFGSLLLVNVALCLKLRKRLFMPLCEDEDRAIFHMPVFPKLTSKGSCVQGVQEPRLPGSGTSFVVPLTQIMQCKKKSFTCDITMSPGLWPLYACFARSTKDGPWERIELTVDIAAAAGMPPLLSCSRADIEVDQSLLGVDDLEACNPESIEAEDTSCLSKGNLFIHDCACNLVARVKHEPDGGCTMTSSGQWPLDIKTHLQDHFITICRLGQPVALATNLEYSRHGTAEEHLQVDVQPGSDSPESAILLMAVLAQIALKPVSQQTASALAAV